METTFGDLLKAFKNSSKEQEALENVVALDDPALRGGLLAWQSMITDYNLEQTCPCLDSKRQWEWMWQNTKFDAKNFAMIAGIKEYETHDMIERLRALRLIYPDGTVNSVARFYLRQIAVSKLPKKAVTIKKEEEKAESEKAK